MCVQFDVEFLPARIWQGMWTALFTICLSVFDCSALMHHVTRFTEEIFSALISLIFIIEALISVVKFYTEGNNGDNVAFFSTMLTFATFGLAMHLRAVKKGNLFTKPIRDALGNYGVAISILAFSGVAAAFKNSRPAMLDAPLSFEPSWVNPKTGKPRAWLVNPMGINKAFPVWAIFASIIPALGLTFLGYMDQNLTSILINRKDHNLKKPPAYHLDLMVCGVFVYPICAFLGLPFTHAATVRSITHLVSLTNYEQVAFSTTIKKYLLFLLCSLFLFLLLLMMIMMMIICCIVLFHRRTVRLWRKTSQRE